MIRPRILVLSTIVFTSFSLVHGQGRSGRQQGAPGAKGVQANSQQRIQSRINQRVSQQAQRRATEGANRAAQHRASAAQRAAQAAARRAAIDAASGKADVRSFANARGVRSETVAAKAAQHADVHAAIAAGLMTGEPIHFTQQQRGMVNEVFGDAGLLEFANGNRSAAKDRKGKPVGKSRNKDQDTARPLPGANANVRARLANAIRVRRAQISELRDQAIDTGDTKLLERADRLEKTLDIFLANQARVETRLAEAAGRSRGDLAVVPGDDNTGDVEPRTADASVEGEVTNELSEAPGSRIE